MITVVARWEDSQMEPELEHRMWRQLKGAFTVEPADMRLIFVPRLHESNSVEQFDTMEAALDAAGDGARVFLEPDAALTLGDTPATDDIVLVIGNTEHSNADYAKQGESFRIETPGATDLYGVNAAAIALAARHGQ